MHPSICLILVLFIYNCHVTHSLSFLVDNDHHGTDGNTSTDESNWPFPAEETNARTHAADSEPTKPRMIDQEQPDQINGSKVSRKQRPGAELERQNREARILLDDLNNSNTIVERSRRVTRQASANCSDEQSCVKCVDNVGGCKYSLQDGRCYNSSQSSPKFVITGSTDCPTYTPATITIFSDFASDVNVSVANIENITSRITDADCDVHDDQHQHITSLNAYIVSTNGQTHFTCPLRSMYPLNINHGSFRLDLTLRWRSGGQEVKIRIDQYVQVTVNRCGRIPTSPEPLYDCPTCQGITGCGWCSVQQCSSPQHCESDMRNTWTKSAQHCPVPISLTISPSECVPMQGNTVVNVTITSGFLPGLNPPFVVKFDSTSCYSASNGTVFECTTLPQTINGLARYTDINVTRGTQLMHSSQLHYYFRHTTVDGFYPVNAIVSKDSDIAIVGDDLHCGGRITISVGDEVCYVGTGGINVGRSYDVAACSIKHTTTGLKNVTVTIDGLFHKFSIPVTVLAFYRQPVYSITDIQTILEELAMIIDRLQTFPAGFDLSDSYLGSMFQPETSKLKKNLLDGFAPPSYGEMYMFYNLCNYIVYTVLRPITNSIDYYRAMRFTMPQCSDGQSFVTGPQIIFARLVGLHLTTVKSSQLVAAVNGMIDIAGRNARLRVYTSIRLGTTHTLGEIFGRNNQFTNSLRDKLAVQNQIQGLLMMVDKQNNQGGFTGYDNFLDMIFDRLRYIFPDATGVLNTVQVMAAHRDLYIEITRLLDLNVVEYDSDYVQDNLIDKFNKTWSTNSLSTFEETVSFVADHAVTISPKLKSSINQFTTALKYTTINRNEDAESAGKRIALNEKTTVKTVLEHLETTLGTPPKTCDIYSRPVDNDVLKITLSSFNDKVIQLMSMRQLIEHSIVDQFFNGFTTQVVMKPQSDQAVAKQLKDIHCTIVKTFMAYSEVGGNAALKDIGLNDATNVTAIFDELTKKLDSTLWTTERATESTSITLQQSTSNADYCPPLGLAENMNMLIDQFPYDGKSTVIHSSVVKLSCKQGYRFIGTNQSITCQLNYGETAKWTNAKYACQRLKCSKLSPRVYRLLHYVRFTLEGQQYNGTDEVEVFDIIAASCEDGYRLVGPKAIKCIVNNITGIPVWNDTMHECVEKWPWAQFRHNLS